MEKYFDRTKVIIGSEGFEKIRKSWVAVFGVGGVGSYAVEALSRSGIGKITIIDSDVIEPSNINRQIHALTNTIGISKVEIMRERIKLINPRCEVETEKTFVSENNLRDLINKEFTYVIDAIDSVKSKIALIEEAVNNSIPIISCMGAGNKLDPTKLKISYLFDTKVCPLAKIVRKEIRRKGIRKKIKVVYSTEKPIKPPNGINGSICSVTATAGLLAAGEVLKDILSIKK